MLTVWLTFASLQMVSTCKHALPIFTPFPLGTYLLSGGEEGVLVLWQHKTNHKHFRPRLGAAISRVSCSPGDAYFAVTLQNNGKAIIDDSDSVEVIQTQYCVAGDYCCCPILPSVVELVSGLNSDVEGVLGGVRRALVAVPGENPVKTGLVLRPSSSSLVLNSSPGFLQFYDTVTGALAEEVRGQLATPHSLNIRLSVCLFSWMLLG